MDMDEILNGGEHTKECKKVSRQELIDRLKQQSDEETKARLTKFLEELEAVFEFTSKRLSEVSNEYEEISALGDFGVVISAAFRGSPMVYSAMGSGKGISDATKLAVFRSVASEMQSKAEEKEGDD